MPSTPQRGFIVRPTQESVEPEPACISGTPIGSMYYSNIRREDAEPEFESVNIQACSDPYSFTSDEVVSTSRCGIATSWGMPVSSDTVSSSSVEERIKDKMLEKIENYLERNQFHDLALLVTTYEKFKELHP